MKEAIQKYIEELYNKVKDLKEGREVDSPQYIGEYTSLINETLRTIDKLENILLESQTIELCEVATDKKPHSQNTHLGPERPLIENSTINTEENKPENWRLTKYP